MPNFHYRAIDQQGQRQSGSASGASREEVARELARSGLIVQHVDPVPTPGDPIPADFGQGTSRGGPRSAVPTAPNPGDPIPADFGRPARATPGPPPAVQGSRGSVVGNRGEPTAPPAATAAGAPGGFARHVVTPIFGKPPLGPLAFFFRQLAAMLNAGVNPVQALDTLITQTPAPKLRPAIRAMRDAAQRNEPLTSAMAQYPGVFSPLMLSLCTAGEQGGFLVESLRQAADYVDKEIALRNMIRRATFLPKMQLLAGLFIIGSANCVANEVAGRQVFSSPLNRIETWYWLGPALLIVFLFLRIGLTYGAIRYSWDALLANVPVLGGAVRQFAMAKFGRALGALYRGGVAIPTAVEYAADSCGNSYLRSGLRQATATLEQGGGIGDTLASTGALSPVVLNMIRTGEATGNLDGMLNSMADYYEDEASVRAVQMSHVLTVIVVLAVIAYLVYVLASALGPVLGGYTDAVKMLDE